MSSAETDHNSDEHDWEACRECVEQAKEDEILGPDAEPHDPNADIVGKTVILADREWSIAGTVSWSNDYVILARPGPEAGLIDGMIRPAGVVRRHLQIVAGER